jgi:Flp pilus assembly protein TadD
MDKNAATSDSWTLELVSDAPRAASAGLTLVPEARSDGTAGPPGVDPAPRLELPAPTPAVAPPSAPAPASAVALQRHESSTQDSRGDATAATPAGASAAPVGADRFLAEAIREMRDGHIDRALWTRAMDLAGGNKDAATPGYLKARATALRLKRRERVAEAAQRRALAAPSETEEDGDGGNGGASAAATKRPSWMPAPKSKLMLLLAVGLGAAVVALVWLFAFPSTEAPASVAASTPSSRSAAPARRDAAPAVPTPEQAAATARALDDEFAARVQALREAGNWNVLVLQASEWTRRRPDNANAWGQLSMGYARLKQRDDAYEAGKKAVQLEPDDPLLWRNLGQVAQTLDSPDEAIAAYRQAIARNERDIESLTQIGALHAQQGRLPEAREAFDRALALIPEDTEALCGQAMIAQKQGRGRDADAILQKLKASDRSCVDRSAPPAATAGVAPAKAAPSARR